MQEKTVAGKVLCLVPRGETAPKVGHGQKGELEVCVSGLQDWILRPLSESPSLKGYKNQM